MKKLNKKGFTIVELVIVISVIAILSAVMVPTFTSIVNKAKKSAAEQEADTALTAVLTEENAVLDSEKDYYFISGDYWFKYESGKLVETDALEGDALEVLASDVVYAATKTSIKPLEDATEADKSTYVELEDMGNVVALKR